MFVKIKTTGKYAKYGIFLLIFKLILIGIYIYSVLIPYGSDFLELLQNSLNIQTWNLFTLFAPIIKMILWIIPLTIVEFIVALMVIKRLDN